MNDGVYFANVDSQARKVDMMHIDRETMEFERLNRATQLRRCQAEEAQNRAQRAKLKKQRARLRLAQSVLSYTVICVGMGVCAWHGLASWRLAIPVMVVCLAAGAWRVGRGCR